jgi:hypothetical protein
VPRRSVVVDPSGARAYGCADVATTAVFAEILIIGLEVEAWLAFLLLSVFGSEWLFELHGLQDFATLLTLVVLALAYVLGIIVDRLADTLADWFEDTDVGDLVKKKMMRKEEAPTDEDPRKPKVATMRMTVMAASDDLTPFLDYQRSRWRIARATVLNLAIAGPVAALYLVVGTNLDWAWALVPAACALVLIPTTYFAGVRIQDAWVARLKDAYEIVRAAPQE